MKVPLTRRSVVVATKSLVSCDVGGDVVMLDLESGQYFGLDGVGARVWSLIRTPRRVNEILGVLLQEYDVDAGRCEKDLMGFLHKLVEKGLVEVKNEGSRGAG